MSLLGDIYRAVGPARETSVRGGLRRAMEEMQFNRNLEREKLAGAINLKRQATQASALKDTLNRSESERDWQWKVGGPERELALYQAKQAASAPYAEALTRLRSSLQDRTPYGTLMTTAQRMVDPMGTQGIDPSGSEYTNTLMNLMKQYSILSGEGLPEEEDVLNLAINAGR